MRVAVQHSDPDHPNHGVFAYRLGRVQGYTDPITGESSSADEVMVALLDQARAEYGDDYEARPERLLCDECGNGPHRPDETCDGETGTWHPIDEDALRARAAGEPVDVNVIEGEAE